jgi:lipopolysaccharide transport system permease protein
MLVLRDIKIRYKQSIMGFMWAILMPMLIVAAGIFVKKAISIFSGKPFALVDIVSVSVKSLPWAFFIGAIRFSTNSLLGNRNLVTKIYFPREVCPFASVLSALFDFMVASVALTVFLIIANIGISIYLLWLPFVLMILILLTSGLGMILACFNLFFRDVKYIVEVFLTFAIFFTPVFYEASMFQRWEKVILLNPVAPILEAINSIVVLHKQPDLFWLSYSAMWSIIGFFIFWVIFHKMEHKFAEII